MLHCSICHMAANLFYYKATCLSRWLQVNYASSLLCNDMCRHAVTTKANTPFTISLIIIDERDYQDTEGIVFLLNSSQHTLNISIPLLNDADFEALRVSLRLLSDDFSCVTVEPATADIHIFDEDEFRGKPNQDQNSLHVH